MFRSVIAALALLFAVSCASSESKCPAGQVKVNGFCTQQGDVTGTPDATVTPDNQLPQDNVVPPNDTVGQDTGVVCDAGFTLEGGVCKDKDAPKLVSVTVGAQTATVFTTAPELSIATLAPTIKLVFDEPVDETSILSGVKLYEGLGTTPANLALTLTGCTGNECTLALGGANPSLLVATPYVIKLNETPLNAIRDKALGNVMTDQITIRVLTGGPAEFARYKTLALKYAPEFKQRMKDNVGGWNIHRDLPVAIDLDANWDAKDNVANLDTLAKVKPTVYWAVKETLSHIYLDYILYYPFSRLGGAESNDLTNNTIGVTVILAKDTAGQVTMPVAFLLHFVRSAGANADMPMITYASESSGLGNKTGVNYLNKKLADNDFAALFANSTTLSLVVQAETHWICLTGTGGDGDSICSTAPVSDKMLTLKPTDQPFLPADGFDHNNFPDPAQHNYQLVSWLAQVWPRRGDALLFADTKPYTPPYVKEGNFPTPWYGTTQPIVFGTNFVKANLQNVASEGGRAAWRWIEQNATAQPGENDPDSWNGLSGIHFIDTAYMVVGNKEASKDDTERLVLEASKANWSRDYCFNAYLNIDVRASQTTCLVTDN